MGCDTYGKIKGYVKQEDILKFIQQKYDKNATSSVSRRITCPLSKCDWKYKINEHSEDNENWYTIYGYICFKYNDENRMLFYCYDNLNHYENLEYYTKFGLEDMVKAETTHIGLGYWGGSVEIIKEIVENFGGGWIDENDCDDEEYYVVDSTKEDEFEMDTNTKIITALYEFERVNGIRPNRINMGCNLVDELKSQFYSDNIPMRTLEVISMEQELGIRCEYEGIPIKIDYENKDVLEVGYMVKWMENKH